MNQNTPSVPRGVAAASTPAPASLATPPPGNFIAMLQNKSGGVSLLDLDQKLASLVRAVKATGEAGTLTYKLKITPNARRGVSLDDDVISKEPKEETGVSYFFADESGALLRNDPNQTEMKLVAVPDSEPLSQSPRVVNN